MKPLAPVSKMRMVLLTQSGRQVTTTMSPLFAKGESPMENWKTSLQRGLVGGAVASLTSTLALALLGKNSSDSMAAPVNAISHWIWGGRQPR